MANTKSASKRSRQTVVRSLRNRSVLTRLRKMQKGVSGAGEGQKDSKSVGALVSAIDKAAKRGIIHRNAANRRKARLNKATSSKAPATAATVAPAVDAPAV